MSVFPTEACAYGLECSPDEALRALAARLSAPGWRFLLRGGLTGSIHNRDIRITWWPPFFQLAWHHPGPVTFVGSLSGDGQTLVGTMQLPFFPRVWIGLMYLLVVAAIVFLACMVASSGSWHWRYLLEVAGFGSMATLFLIAPRFIWADTIEGRDHIDIALQTAVRGIGV